MKEWAIVFFLLVVLNAGIASAIWNEDGEYCDSSGRQGTICKAFSHCVDNICRAGKVGDLCFSRSDCKITLNCVDNICYEGKVGDPCHTRSDCGAVWGKLEYVCVKGKCNTGSWGEECETKEDCINSFVCVNGICYNGTEGDSCRNVFDCKNEFYCENSVCKNPPLIQISSLIKPEEKINPGGKIPISVEIKNLESTEIKNLKLSWSINGKEHILNQTVNLLPLEKKTVSAEFVLDNGINYVWLDVDPDGYFSFPDLKYHKSLDINTDETFEMKVDLIPDPDFVRSFRGRSVTLNPKSTIASPYDPLMCTFEIPDDIAISQVSYTISYDSDGKTDRISNSKLSIDSGDDHFRCLRKDGKIYCGGFIMKTPFDRSSEIKCSVSVQSNNNRVSRDAKIKVADSLFIYVPIFFNGDADGLSRIANDQQAKFESIIQNSNVLKIVRAEKSCEKTSDLGSSSLAELRDCAQELNEQWSPKHDRILGITSKTSEMWGFSDTVGFAPIYGDSLVCGDGDLTCIHELGHTYGMCEEYYYEATILETVVGASVSWLKQNLNLMLRFKGGCRNPYPECCNDVVKVGPVYISNSDRKKLDLSLIKNADNDIVQIGPIYSNSFNTALPEKNGCFNIPHCKLADEIAVRKGSINFLIADPQYTDTVVKGCSGNNIEGKKSVMGSLTNYAARRCMKQPIQYTYPVNLFGGLK